MAAVIGYARLGIGLLGIVDAFRHSPTDWAAADRQRPFWVIFMFFFGPIFAPIYAVAVRPRFARARAVSDEFRRR